MLNQRRFTPTDVRDKFEARTGSWVGPFSVLYIDNPVFAGYSFSSSGPRTTQEEYGQDLYEFVQQFYKLFPHLLSIDLYIGGQSYAGKYVPVLAHWIHSSRQNAPTRIPLRGLYIGGPLFAPAVMFPENFEYLYNVGAISKHQRTTGRKQTQDLVDRYLKGELDPADTIRQIMPLIFSTQIPSYDNYVTGEKVDFQRITAIMTSDRLRKALHVGSRDYVTMNGTLFSQFHSDIMSDTRDKLSELLDAGEYKVLIYSGDVDVMVSVAMVEAALLATPWSGRGAYENSSRKPWYGQPSPTSNRRPLYGYYSKTSQLCRVVVRGAGHQTPHDQPAISREMMLQFVHDDCVGVMTT
ncbi:carboxypeptidase [Elysia marginata]|uniref:Carboxypeptidase n=1 Tax=Elysia marginata TaxID=1093978 RepID=A0AAV4G064_9GAST|nr:carboxypeptidase [Elysia marginata]